MKKRISLALVAIVAVAGALMMQGDVDAAATLTSRFYLQISQTYSNALDLGTVRIDQPFTKSLDLASGTGVNQADQIFTDTRTVAASTTEDLDIRGTSLTDAFGANVAMVRMKLLVVCAAAGNTNTVVVGGDANSVPFLSTAATTTALPPNGCFVYFNPSAAGVTVTDTTGDVIQVANGGAGTSVTYDILVIGAKS